MASKRHQRRKSREGKRAFATQEEAGKQAGIRSRICGKYLTAYRCEFCRNYHLGHPPRKVRQALRAQKGYSF